MSVQEEILRLGVDLISWHRIERFLAEHSFESLKRILAPSEQQVFQQSAHPAQSLARFFTAKEAAFKAEGGFWMDESDFRRIEILIKNDWEFTAHLHESEVFDDIKLEGRFFETPNGLGARVNELDLA